MNHHKPEGLELNLMPPHLLRRAEPTATVWAGESGRCASQGRQRGRLPAQAARWRQPLRAGLHKSTGAVAEDAFFSCCTSQGATVKNHKAALRPQLAGIIRVRKIDFFFVVNIMFFDICLYSCTLGMLCMSSSETESAFSLKAVLSQRSHTFIRVPSCLWKQDMPKSHLKFEGLVHQQKNKASGFYPFYCCKCQEKFKINSNQHKVE